MRSDWTKLMEGPLHQCAVMTRAAAKARCVPTDAAFIVLSVAMDDTGNLLAFENSAVLASYLREMKPRSISVFVGEDEDREQFEALLQELIGTESKVH